MLTITLRCDAPIQVILPRMKLVHGTEITFLSSAGSVAHDNESRAGELFH